MIDYQGLPYVIPMVNPYFLFFFNFHLYIKLRFHI